MQTLNEQFLESVEKNDIDETIKLIKKGADINYYDGCAFLMSIDIGSYEIAKLLFESAP